MVGYCIVLVCVWFEWLASWLLGWLTNWSAAYLTVKRREFKPKPCHFNYLYRGFCTSWPIESNTSNAHMIRLRLEWTTIQFISWCFEDNNDFINVFLSQNGVWSCWSRWSNSQTTFFDRIKSLTIKKWKFKERPKIFHWGASKICLVSIWSRFLDIF